MGSLRVERKDLEDYLQQLHTDNQKHVDLMLLADIISIGKKEQFRGCGVWKENTSCPS